MTELQKANEEKKLYLSQYKELKKKAARLEESINELRINKMFPSVVMSDMPSAHNQSDLSQYMAVLDDKIQELVTARYKAIEKYTEIYRHIELMENENERMVLTYKYLRNYTWEKIAEKMNYNVRSIYKLHGRALKNFE